MARPQGEASYHFGPRNRVSKQAVSQDQSTTTRKTTQATGKEAAVVPMKRKRSLLPDLPKTRAIAVPALPGNRSTTVKRKKTHPRIEEDAVLSREGPSHQQKNRESIDLLDEETDEETSQTQPASSNNTTALQRKAPNVNDSQWSEVADMAATGGWY